MTETKKGTNDHLAGSRDLPGLILATMTRIVNGMDEPYILNPGGKKGYPPRTMAIVCIMLDAERRTYRKMARFLRADRKAACMSRDVCN